MVISLSNLTANDLKEIQESVFKAIDNRIAKCIENIRIEKTLFGKVTNITGNKANVLIDGETYTCRVKDGISITVGDVVIIKKIGSSYCDKYIDGKLK